MKIKNANKETYTYCGSTSLGREDGVEKIKKIKKIIHNVELRH